MSKLRYFCKEKVEDLLVKDEFYCLKRVMKGSASKDDQMRAISLIALKIAGLNDQSFCPENPSITQFNEGARFVGRFLLMVDKAPGDLFERIKAKKEGKSYTSPIDHANINNQK